MEPFGAETIAGSATGSTPQAAFSPLRPLHISDKKGLSVLTAPAWTHFFAVSSEVAKDAVFDLIRRFMEADRPL